MVDHLVYLWIQFFIYYFPLVIIAVGMLGIVLYNFKAQKRQCSYILAIIGVALLLSIFIEVQAYGSYINNKLITTLFSVLGYVIRPFVVFLFILLGDGKFKKKRLWLLIPLGINLIIYSFMLFFNTPLEKLVVYYAHNEETGILSFHRPTVLGYSSHVVSAILLAVLIISSIRSIKKRHSLDSFAILSCCFFVIVAVIVESLTDHNNLLNNAIGVSCVFYYLFMFNEMNRRDALTGLFDRKTYYSDESRFGKEVTGVIHIDVNGLKTLNDNLGHEEGDKAIAMVATIIKDNALRDMYGYRVGGDEYVILCVGQKEDVILQIMAKMKEQLSLTPYSASFGHGMRKDKSDTVDMMLKAAEVEMYNDKAEYYQSHNIERRRR